MLAAYIDESGTHEEAASPHFCIGATLATLDQWRAFEEEWLPVVSALPHGFHAQARECAGLAVPLARLMRKHTSLSCNIAFKRAQYDRVVPKDLQGRFGGQYRLGVIACMLTLAQWSKERGAGRIGYYVEQGHRSYSHVRETLNAISESDEMREFYQFEAWGPVTKKDLPVHCADAVAHYVCGFENDATKDHAFMAILRGGAKLREGIFSEDILSTLYVPKMRQLARFLRLSKEKVKRERKRRTRS